MRKWTVLLVAIVFTMGLAATGFAFGPDVEANGNDLVGAANGGTAANDQSIAVGDADLSYDASTNTDTENVTVTKTETETETNTANSSFNDTDTKNVDVSKTVDVTKNSTEQAGVSGDGAAANNGGTALDITTGDVLPDNHSETYNDSNDDNRSYSKTVTVTETETETSSSNESQYESQFESQNESQYQSQFESQYENMDGQVATDSGTNNNTEMEDFATVGNDGAAANNGGKAINGSFNGNQVAGEIVNDNHVPGEKVVTIDESVDDSYTDTSTYSDTSTYNKQEAEAEGLGNASAIGGNATSNVDKSDNSIHNTAEEGGVIATDTGTATLDKSFNLTVGDINTAISSTDLSSEVSGNSIGGGYGLDGFSDGPFGRKGAGSELKMDTGNNRVESVTSTGIMGVNQNTGVQSSVQGSINVNATVGNIQ